MPDGAAEVARPPSDASVSPSRRKLSRVPSGTSGLKKAKTYSELQGVLLSPLIYPPRPDAKMLGLGTRQGEPTAPRHRALFILAADISTVALVEPWPLLTVCAS